MSDLSPTKTILVLIFLIIFGPWLQSLNCFFYIAIMLYIGWRAFWSEPLTWLTRFWNSLSRKVIAFLKA